MAYSDNVYAPDARSPANRVHADLTHVERTSAYGAERVAIWIMMILALAFWLPYTFIVDHGILSALF
jgi:hypothetical protein